MNWTTVSQKFVVSDFLYYEAVDQIDIELECPKSDETSCSTINKGRIFIFKCLILAVCKQIAAMGNCRVPEQNECRDNSCATGYGGKGCDFTMCRCYKPISINCGDKYKPINNVNDGNSQKKYSGFGDELCGMCC